MGEGALAFEHPGHVAAQRNHQRPDDGDEQPDLQPAAGGHGQEKVLAFWRSYRPGAHKASIPNIAPRHKYTTMRAGETVRLIRDRLTSLAANYFLIRLR